jgi:hypothetical protein
MDIQVRLRNDPRANDVAQDQRHEKSEGAIDPLIKKFVFTYSNKVNHVNNKKYERAKYP